MASRNSFEQWAQRQVQPIPGGVRLFDGASLFLVDREPIIGDHVRRDGFWESWVSLAIARRVEPGMRCLDVGANQGYYTALLRAQCGPSGHVWAVEPSRQLCGLLEKSIEANGWQNVSVIPAALGDRNAASTLWVDDERRINGSLCYGWGGYKVAEPCEVRTLDSLAAEIGRIDFAKIDVDSGEEDLWRGGRETLATIPLVVLEVRADRYKRPEAFLANIRQVFPVLRMIDFDGEIRPVSDEQIMSDPATDYLLWLER